MVVPHSQVAVFGTALRYAPALSAPFAAALQVRDVPTAEAAVQVLASWVTAPVGPADAAAAYALLQPADVARAGVVVARGERLRSVGACVWAGGVEPLLPALETRDRLPAQPLRQ